MKKKLIPILAVGGVILLIIITLGITILMSKYSPSKERQDLSEYYGVTETDDIAIVINDSISDVKGKLIDGSVYVDFNFVHDYLNQHFYWDSNEKVMLYTNDKDLITIKADSKSYSVNKNAEDYDKTIVKATSDSAMVELEFVKKYTKMSSKFVENPNRVVISTVFGNIKTATVKKDTEIRVKGGIKSNILTEVSKDSFVTIIEEGNKWHKVSTADGFVGYISTKNLSDVEETTVSLDFEEETFQHILKDKKISMVWHQVTVPSVNKNISKVLSSSKGVNVISPTWFRLSDEEGNISDMASKDYVKYCHKQHVEVWPTINNVDNTDVNCEEVLSHTSKRQHLVEQLIANATKYELDGINVDIEALNPSVGDSYIQFIRELSVKCNEKNLVLSVDNYVPSEYTAFYNRGEQALYADYVVIMGYDEHYAGSDAGSVSSIGWLTEGVENTLAKVPAEQVILGMPFYTRLWEVSPKDGSEATTENDNGLEYNVKSTVYGMNGGYEAVKSAKAKAEWNSESGQDYAEWTKGESTFKIWLENEKSTEERLKLVSDKSLAGAAYWKSGLENPKVWDTINKYIK